MNKTVEKTLKNFTNQFPISKTLRFELKPIGETLEYIKVNLLTFTYGSLGRGKDRKSNV